MTCRSKIIQFLSPRAQSRGLLLILLLFSIQSFASVILIPMDAEGQENHLKAYGITYWVLSKQQKVQWLLNYRGGSFLLPDGETIRKECQIRGVSFEVLSDDQANQILDDISSPSQNQDAVILEKAPKIAVYSPKGNQPWDDAVTMVLTYAEIPYTTVYDEEVLGDKLALYDWLHLHHEDFTGQYGKFWARYRDADWYRQDVAYNEEIAHKLGFSKVSQCKLAVAQKIRDFTAGGGYLFSMCSAPDSYDVALAAEGVDICDYMFDGDPPDPNAQAKLDYSKCFAFTNFTISTNPFEYEISSIDVDPQQRQRMANPQNDYFSLFEFSAKWDPVPTMLCQDHTQVIKGFMGQTTAFRKQYVKPNVLVMGENKSLGEVRYIHGEYGKGMWTFLAGHDPEDYQHFVGDPPTDLNLHPNSPGFRLILNNVLFPAAKKKKQKT
ncbi:MAG: asparagine synthetase B [Muricauda sp.]|nr:asparagine synthetase B [Allomuricauda sp.]